MQRAPCSVACQDLMHSTVTGVSSERRDIGIDVLKGASTGICGSHISVVQCIPVRPTTPHLLAAGMRTDSPFSTSGSPGRYRISTWSNTTCSKRNEGPFTPSHEFQSYYGSHDISDASGRLTASYQYMLQVRSAAVHFCGICQDFTIAWHITCMLLYDSQTQTGQPLPPPYTIAQSHVYKCLFKIPVY